MNSYISGRSNLYTIDNYNSGIDYNYLNNLNYNIEPEIIIYGKKVRQRRDIAFYSDESIGYKYSGQIARSIPLTNELRSVMKNVNKYLNTNFNGILINRYINGEKYIGPHSDDERFLSNGTVASLSFGATRTFRIRNKSNNKTVLDLEVEDGTLLVMSGDFQKEYKHELPVRKRVNESRISLTFRHHNE